MKKAIYWEFLLVSKTFFVPKTTLIRMCQSKAKTSDLLTKPLGRNPVLSKDIEDDLSEVC